MNPTAWIKQTNYLEQVFGPSLQAFTTQRAELLAVLEPLSPEAWSRTAIVTGAGKPRERSVRTYAQWLANHEQSHLKQIERIVNTLHSRPVTPVVRLMGMKLTPRCSIGPRRRMSRIAVEFAVKWPGGNGGRTRQLQRFPRSGLMVECNRKFSTNTDRL